MMTFDRKDVFDSNLYVDDTSPTGLRWLTSNSQRKADSPAGYLAKHVRNGKVYPQYQVKVTIHDGTGDKQVFVFQNARCVAEHHLGRELEDCETINYLDNNSSNLSPDNLAIAPRMIANMQADVNMTKLNSRWEVNLSNRVTFATEEEALKFREMYVEFIHNTLIKPVK